MLPSYTSPASTDAPASRKVVIDCIIVKNTPEESRRRLNNKAKHEFQPTLYPVETSGYQSGRSGRST